MSGEISDSEEFIAASLLSNDGAINILDVGVHDFSNNSLSCGPKESHNSPSSVFTTEQGQTAMDSSTATMTTTASGRTSVPARRVDHTYRDYSKYKRITPMGDQDEFDRDKKLESNFPAKLHTILSNPEYRHIISWMPHGRGWKILDKELLVSVVCNKFFSHSKYQSFTRQVNGWGFKRLHQSGSDFKTYYHQCFLRGLPQLTPLMKRAVANQGKLLPDKEGEPNFYVISQSFPVPLYEGDPLVVAEPPLPYGHPGCNSPGTEGGSTLHLMSATSAGYPQPPPSGNEVQTGSYPPYQPPPAPAYYGGNLGHYSPHAAYGSTPIPSYYHEHAPPPPPPPGAPYSPHASSYHHHPPPPFSYHQSVPHSLNKAAPAPVGGDYFATPPPPSSYGYGPPTTPTVAPAGNEVRPSSENASAPFQCNTRRYQGQHYSTPYNPALSAPPAAAAHSSPGGSNGGYNPSPYDPTDTGHSSSMQRQEGGRDVEMTTTQEEKHDYFRLGGDYPNALMPYPIRTKIPRKGIEHRHPEQQNQDDYHMASSPNQPVFPDPASVGGIGGAVAASDGANSMHHYAVPGEQRGYNYNDGHHGDGRFN